MKFSTAVIVTAFMATSVMAVPAAEAEPKLVRAGKFGNWCIAPGQLCYKSKRDLDDAKSLVAAGFEAPHPEKREALPALVRAGKFGNWCIAPGQLCYKSKRDYDDASSLVSVGFEAPHPDEISKRDAEPKLVRAGKFGNWCIAPGQLCYKSKRDYDSAAEHVAAGLDAPHPDEISKREASPALVRAGKFGNWCIAPGQLCYKSKRDLTEATDLVLAGYEAPLPTTTEGVEKREAEPKLVRAGKFGNWCIAPGQLCYKSKRDLADATSYIAAGEYAPVPADYE